MPVLRIISQTRLMVKRDWICAGITELVTKAQKRCATVSFAVSCSTLCVDFPGIKLSHKSRLLHLSTDVSRKCKQHGVTDVYPLLPTRYGMCVLNKNDKSLFATVADSDLIDR